MTSHDVVNRLRRITGERSIGHLGTLDPMATGVLPLLMGKYTRLAQYFSAAEKSYCGDDPLRICDRHLRRRRRAGGAGLLAGSGRQAVTLERVRAAAARFHGEMEQMPPQFSAKKIDGQPAYKLAREGKPVELKPAQIRIDAFEILALEGPEASFTIDISSGGYVRSVAHELGQELGCGAHLSRLRRTRAGVFTLDDAHTLEELEALAGNPDARSRRVCVHPRTAAAGDAFRHRRHNGAGPAAQRRAGQSAGVLRGAAGQGVRRAARAGRNRQTRGGNTVSAGGGDGVKAGDKGTRDRGNKKTKRHCDDTGVFVVPFTSFPFFPWSLLFPVFLPPALTA